MKGLFKLSLADQVYEAIKEKIIRLEYEFGQRIDVKKLSEEFGISPTPIRFALNKLCESGLVASQSRMGYYVIDLSEEDLEEIYDLREMFETYSLKSAIKNIDTDRLLSLKKRMEEIRTTEDSDKLQKDFHDTDRELHMMLIESYENRRAKELYLQIYGVVDMSIQMGIEWQEPLEAHLNLIDSILQKDLPKAKEILSRHLSWAKDNALKQLKIKRSMSDANK